MRLQKRLEPRDNLAVRKMRTLRCGDDFARRFQCAATMRDAAGFQPGIQHGQRPQYHHRIVVAHVADAKSAVAVHQIGAGFKTQAQSEGQTGLCLQPAPQRRGVVSGRQDGGDRM